MTQLSSQRLSSELQLLSVVLVWGVNFPVSKWILLEIRPHVMNVFRLGAAAVVLSALLYRRCGNDWSTFWKPLQTDFKSFAFIALIGWVLYQVAFITGLNNTSAGNSAIIMSSAPIWTALIAAFFAIERISGVAWLGLLISLIGTGVIILSGPTEVDLASTYFLGNAIILVAAILWGAYTAFTRQLVQKHTPLSLTVLALIIALPAIGLVSIPYWSAIDWQQVTFMHWVAMFFSGSLSTGLAIVFWNNAVKSLGASHTAAYGNLVPLIALFSGFFMLGDTILPVQLIGGTLIIGGLVVMRWARRRHLARD